MDRLTLTEKLDRLDRIWLANLPTPVYRMNMSRDLGKNIWIKRDDFTGAEMSGNKVRKLEFTIAEAMREGADVLITAGGIQSNHARATAAAAAVMLVPRNCRRDIPERLTLFIASVFIKVVFILRDLSL